MKMLRALPLLIVALGFSSTLVAEPELYNERMLQEDYDSIVNQIEQTGYAEIFILIQHESADQKAKEYMKKNNYKWTDKRVSRKQKELRKQVQEKTIKAIERQLSGRYFQISEEVLLPIFMIRIDSVETLEILASMPEIKHMQGRRNDTRLNEVFNQEAVKLIDQPTAAARGYRGTGKIIAVIDSGARLNSIAAGECTAINTPSNTCRIVDAYVCFNRSAEECSRAIFNPWGSKETHADRVLRNALQAAPNTKFIFFDIGVSGDNVDYDISLADEDIFAALTKVKELSETLPIAAVNMSFSDSTKHTSPCRSSKLYDTLLSDLVFSMIMPVAGSGNDGYTNGLPEPACSPWAVSVGAVHAHAEISDNHQGYLDYPCEETSYAGKIPCFSNSAYFLDFLAPGVGLYNTNNCQPEYPYDHFSVGDATGNCYYAGTSFAAPNVAGAIAVLTSAKPGVAHENSTVSGNTYIKALKESGAGIVDDRNGYGFPLIKINAALDRLFSLTGGSDGSEPDFVAPIASSTSISVPSTDSDNDGAYTINWLNTDGADSYWISENTTNDFPSAKRIYMGPNTSKSLSGRGDDSYDYWYWAQACNESYNSNTGVTTKLCSEPTAGKHILVVKRPGVPSSISRSTEYTQSGDYTISWGAADGLTTFYVIYEKLENDPDNRDWHATYAVDGLSKSYFDRPVNTYYHKVQACNKHYPSGIQACSGFTDITSVTVWQMDYEPPGGCAPGTCPKIKFTDPEPISE